MFMCNNFIIRLISFDDAEKDYEAVMESAKKLKGIFNNVAFPGREITWEDYLSL